MADIFISYKSEEKKNAEMLANTLIANKMTVWWDRDLLGGIDYDKAISTELSDAKVVIVIWSQLSIESRYVKDEARIALERNALLPVTFDKSKAPIGFGMIQALALDEELQNNENLKKLFDSIKNKIGFNAATQQSQIIIKTKKKSNVLKWMFIFLSVGILSVVIYFTIPELNINKKPEEDFKNKAGKISEMVVFGRYDDMSSLMVPSLKPLLTKELFMPLIDSVNKKLGNFIKPMDTVFVKDIQFSYYLVRNQYERGVSINKIMLDNKGNIFGIYIEQ